MQQVLFHLPILKETFPPDGLPINGYGVMLFITFIACVWFLTRLSVRMGTGLPRDRVQDLVIACFVGGLIGARITFLIVDDGRHSFREFFRIWEGGIVLYGGIIAGILVFLAFYYLFLKRAGVSLWKLADAAAPPLALGIALGRIGCFLNGCCYGHIAPEDCPSAAFPLLTCPAKSVVVDQEGFQTATGFTVKSGGDDLRSVVDRVEPLSAASRAGLEPGDRIVGVNGRLNVGVLTVVGEAQPVDAAANVARQQSATVDEDDSTGSRRLKISIDDLKAFAALKNKLNSDLLFAHARVYDTDRFTDLINNWPRGDQSLDLDVERNGQTVHVGPFMPRTLGLHPTQLYETVSMVLLVFLLLSFYPFRRHDGQVMSLFIACYAVHRFLDEALRNDTPTMGLPQLHLSLSQNISVLMLLFAIALEVGHWYRGKRQATAAVA
jgi:phosphatidylglycerol---prolipoprotein diacylglyceryl transferase